MKQSGYSGTPLAKKLGIKPKSKIRLFNQPDYYCRLLPDLPPDTIELPDKKSKKDFIHYFALSTAQLKKDLKSTRGIFKTKGHGQSWKGFRHPPIS